MSEHPARRSGDPWWTLAWLGLVLAIPLRLAFFAGFGLGDDPGESFALMDFAQHLRLNPANFMHYRVINVVLRGLLYRAFSVNELAFVLPILAFALGTHAMAIVLARDLLGARGAFLTSLLFLVTPYETLASTANVPDYIHAFFGVACAWAAYRGYHRRSDRYMALAAVFLVLGLLNRLSMVLLVQTLGVATLCTLRQWRRWVALWAVFAVLVGLVCLADFFYSGLPYGWIANSSGGMGGLDVTRILGFELMVYPRYVFHHNDYPNWMFGLTGWCALLGALLALGRAVLRRAGGAEWFVVLAFFVFVALFELMPHRLTLHAYWSHPRIFRYLAQVSPALYLSGAYLLDRLWALGPRRSPVGLGAVLCVAVALFGLQQTPRVAEPLSDANRDCRHLIAFLRGIATDKPTPLFTDSWRVALIQAQYPRHYKAWMLRGVGADSKDEKVRFLRSVREGLVITGGATLPWYSGIDLIVSLSRLDFTVPPSWTLLREFDGKLTSWRVEPLRVWSVKGQDSAATPAVHVDTSQEPKALFAAGMASFDRGDCPGARPYFQAIIDRSPPAELAPDGWYFDTICRFRDGDWEGTLAGFQELVRRFPGSIYVPGAYYHMGLAYAGLGDTARARQTFEYVREQFPRDETVSRMAAERLAEMPADRGAGLLGRLWKRLWRR